MNYVSGLKKNPTIPYQHLLTLLVMQVTILFYSNQILKRLNRGNANTLHTSMTQFSYLSKVFQSIPKVPQSARK